jgi:hypothetical protein
MAKSRLAKMLARASRKGREQRDLKEHSQNVRHREHRYWSR